MSEKKRTDYSKLKVKSNSSSVRFNLEHLSFIKKREPLLKTSQQIIDFLLGSYYKTYRAQPSNPFEQIPIYEDSNQLNKKSEPFYPIQEEEVIKEKASKLSEYLSLIKNSESSMQVQNILLKAKQDDLSFFNKKEVEEAASEKYKELGY